MIRLKPDSSVEHLETIELYSNLSMSLDRFFAVFLALSGVILLVALYPLILGLWPVMAIALFHILMVGCCFRSAWRGNWAREVIHFGPETVTIEHAAAKENWSLEWPLAWLKVNQVPDRRKGLIVLLRKEALSKEIGAFLPCEERRELYELVRNVLSKKTAWSTVT